MCVTKWHDWHGEEWNDHILLSRPESHSCSRCIVFINPETLEEPIDHQKQAIQITKCMV